MANPIHKIVRKIAATRPISWVTARWMHKFDPLVLRLSGGRTTLTKILIGLPITFVTMTGAKSGVKRSVPLLYIPDETDPHVIALIASNWGQARNPGWYYNLIAHPDAECTIDGTTAHYLAAEAHGEEYARHWAHAVNRYAGYSAYKSRAGVRHIPIMVLRKAG